LQLPHPLSFDGEIATEFSDLTFDHTWQVGRSRPPVSARRAACDSGLRHSNPSGAYADTLELPMYVLFGTHGRCATLKPVM
jgi:hypothetical protein